MKNTDQEIKFLATEAQKIQGDITVSSIISHCKVGYNKAKSIFDYLQEKGVEVVIEPEAVDQTIEPVAETIPVEETVIVVDEVLPEKDHSQELAIIEAGSQPLNLGAALGQLLQKFSMGEKLTQCVPIEGTTDLDIGRGIQVLTGVKNWTELGLGDLINELESRGHENVIPAIISNLGLEESYSTLSAYARTAKVVSNELRELPGLRYSHLNEVACSKFSDDPEKQSQAVKEVLIAASEKGLNVAQTREAVLNRKGKSTKPTPKSTPTVTSKHGRYIVVSKIECEHSYSTDQLPDADGDHIVIDTLDSVISCHACSGLPTWIPLPLEKLAATATEVEVEAV